MFVFLHSRMTTDKSLRNLIKSHYESGKKASEIYHCLNKTVKIRTIYNWIKIFNRSGAVEAKTSPGAPRKVRSKAFVKMVHRNVRSNKKTKSARAIAREKDCDHKTVLNAIHHDLNLKCYRRIKVPDLTDEHKDQRLKFARWVRKHFTRESSRKIMFSDEKMFDGDGQLNPQNDVVYAESREDANNNGGLRPTKKYPAKLMVWVGVTFYGITKFVDLPLNTSFDSDFYVSKVLPIARRDGERLIGPDFIFQQDGASVHTSHQSIAKLTNTFPSFIEPDRWPANSPDLNPLDYFYWDALASRLVKGKKLPRKKLLEEIKKTSKKIPLKMVQDSIDNFVSRCLAVEKNNGGLILNKFS